MVRKWLHCVENSKLLERQAIKFGKNIKLFFGDIITKEDLDYKDSHGNAIRQFNETLNTQLSKYVFEIDSHDKAALHDAFYINQSPVKKILLFVPAAMGAIVHTPLFYFVKWLGNTLIKEEGHDDSKLIGFLFIFYPVFLLLLSGIVFYITGNWFSFSLLLVLPFTAWSYVQLKKQLD